MFLLAIYLFVLIYGLSKHIFTRQIRPSLFATLALVPLSLVLSFAPQDASDTLGKWEDINSYVNNIPPAFSFEDITVDPAFALTLSFLQLLFNPTTIFYFILPILSVLLLLLAFSFVPHSHYRHSSLYFLFLLLLPTQSIQESLFSYIRFGNATALFVFSFTLLLSSTANSRYRLIFSIAFFTYSILTHLGLILPALMFAFILLIYYICFLIDNQSTRRHFLLYSLVSYTAISTCLGIYLSDINLFSDTLLSIFPVRASNYISLLYGNTYLIRNFDIPYLILASFALLFSLVSAPTLKTHSYLLALSSLTLSLFLFILLSTPLAASFPVILRYFPLSQILLILSLSNTHLVPVHPRQYLSVSLSLLLFFQSVAFII